MVLYISNDDPQCDQNEGAVFKHLTFEVKRIDDEDENASLRGRQLATCQSHPHCEAPTTRLMPSGRLAVFKEAWKPAEGAGLPFQFVFLLPRKKEKKKKEKKKKIKKETLNGIHL